jgi:hypothetical protein
VKNDLQNLIFKIIFSSFTAKDAKKQEDKCSQGAGGNFWRSSPVHKAAKKRADDKREASAAAKTNPELKTSGMVAWADKYSISHRRVARGQSWREATRAPGRPARRTTHTVGS